MILGEKLRDLQTVLLKKDASRRKIQADMRKALRLSKKAIFQIHKGELQKAEQSLKETQNFFTKLNELTQRFPDLRFMGIVSSAFQEYTESNIFLALVKKTEFPEPEAIAVSETEYILGLADVVGELRRRTLDSMRFGQIQVAEKYLEIMDHIHSELINLEEIQYLVSGLRVKCDVNRRVIESTRADLVNEMGRRALDESIQDLRVQLGK